MKAPCRNGELEYVGRIHESLHGFIHLTQVEKELIDCPYLQRLRQIKQLGLAHLVFPGGEHTRFSHSLGVMWVIDRISRHLQFDPRTRQVLRLAALLHDVGHFPLSHTLEAAYEDAEDKVKKTNTGLLVRKHQAAGPGRRKGARLTGKLLPGGAALHERLSRHVIEETDFPDGVTCILKNHRFIPNEIGSIVVGESNVMLYNQLMHSDIDADQMDYLIRDATCLGIGYGQFAIEYLIECFKTAKIDGQDLLCIKEKGIHTVDHYLLAKYFYRVQVLYHRTRWIIEEAAQKLYGNLMGSRKAKPVPGLMYLPDMVQDIMRWASFDDSWVMGVFRQAEVEKWLAADCACLFDIVLRRRIPTCVYEKTVNRDKDGPDDVLGACREQMERSVASNGTGLSATCIDLHHLSRKFTVVKSLAERGYKDEKVALKEDRDIIRILDHETDKPLLIGRDSASFAQYLQKIETHVFRVYTLKPSHQPSSRSHLPVQNRRNRSMRRLLR